MIGYDCARLLVAGIGLLITGGVATGWDGTAVAGETLRPVESSSGSKPAARLAFNASGHRAASESRPLADRLAPADVSAVAALRETADAGDPHAQFDLGLCFESGLGVSKDPAEAIKWFRRAAELGFDEAQYMLGCCYNGDDGFPRNPREAAKWWGKAAAHGHANAQYCLGLSYSLGEGVAKNPTEAAKWWTKAAEQGQADAQYFLGLSYSLGLGLPKVPEQAVYWLRKAASNGNENAIAALKKFGKDSAVPAKKQSADHSRPGGAGGPA